MMASSTHQPLPTFFFFFMLLLRASYRRTVSPFIHCAFFVYM